jgi:hypothetical protein
MLHSQLKRPTISTLFQRPSEGVGKCDFRVTTGGGKKLMAIQTTKRVTIWNPTHLDRIGQNNTYVSEHGTDMFIPCTYKYITT